MEEPVVKRKKGRPRKIKPDELFNEDGTPKEEVVKEKKKRGRKKKEVPPQEEVVKQKKKRGRKTAVKYFSSSIRKKMPLTTIIKDNDNYILHIDIKDEESVNVQQDTNKNSVDTNETTETENYEINKTFQKHPVIDSLPKEIKEILNNNENEDDLLSNLIDMDEKLESEKNIKDLYEKRLEFREKQDQLLSVKLEEMHKDEHFLNQLLENDEKPEYNSPNDDYLKVKNKVQENNKKKGYFQILYDFIHNKEWLHKTDVCCWWCCHDFNTVPLGLPLEYKKKINKFLVKGVFCSFACMLSYNNEKKYNDKLHLINSRYIYIRKKS
jgi:hypothetical protein